MLRTSHGPHSSSALGGSSSTRCFPILFVAPLLLQRIQLFLLLFLMLWW